MSVFWSLSTINHWKVFMVTSSSDMLSKVRKVRIRFNEGSNFKLLDKRKLTLSMYWFWLTIKKVTSSFDLRLRGQRSWKFKFYSISGPILCLSDIVSISVLLKNPDIQLSSGQFYHLFSSIIWHSAFVKRGLFFEVIKHFLIQNRCMC